MKAETIDMQRFRDIIAEIISTAFAPDATLDRVKQIIWANLLPQSIGEACNIAQTMWSNEYGEDRDLFKDLSRVYDGAELDCYSLMRCLEWGINIDLIECPIFRIEDISRNYE